MWVVTEVRRIEERSIAHVRLIGPHHVLVLRPSHEFRSARPTAEQQDSDGMALRSK